MKQFDVSGLSRVTVFSDGVTADIRMMEPLRFTPGAHGMVPVPDPARPLKFWSTITITIGPGQQIPWNFEIPAGSLEEACERCTEEGVKAGKAAIEQIQGQRLKAQLLAGGGRSQ